MSVGEMGREWDSLQEQDLLLQNYLHRVSDLLDVPPNIENETEFDFTVADADELCRRIESFSAGQTNQFATLVQYRVSALRELWTAKEAWRRRQRDKDPADQESTKRKGPGTSSLDGALMFSSKLSLMLIFPLIESQTRLDPGLCGVTTRILLQSLRECPPLTLRDPADALNGLENLLCSWLGEGADGIVSESGGQKDVETIAATLVALACARSCKQTVVHTLYILKQLKTVKHLPVNDIIYILGALDGGPSIPPHLQGSKFVTSFCREEPSATSNDDQVDGSIVERGRRSVGTDGIYLYVTNSTGSGVVMIGSGLHGTFKGHVYAKNTTIQQGIVCYADGVLLHKSLEEEDNLVTLATVLDPRSLQVKFNLKLPQQLQVDCPSTTLALVSNGMEFYWIRSVSVEGGEGGEVGCSHIVLLDVFTVNNNNFNITVKRPRVILSGRDDPNSRLQGGLDNILRKTRTLERITAVDIVDNDAQELVDVRSANSDVRSANSDVRSANSDVRSANNDARTAHGVTSAGLTRVGSNHSSNSSGSSGGSPTTANPPPPPPASNGYPTNKDLNSTSCGIPYKTLVVSPIFTCGTFVTILSPPCVSASSGAQMARSILSGGQYTTAKVHATAHCFSTRDGQYVSKYDFADCPSSSLGRGRQLSDYGTTFDTLNNCIWCVGGDKVDQFNNTGHRAPSFVAKRLGLPEESRLQHLASTEGNMAPIEEICNVLLRHVGLLSSHVVDMTKNTGMSGDRNMSLLHVKRLLYLLKEAVDTEDGTSTSCLLVTLQATIKTNMDNLEDRGVIKDLKDLLFKVINEEKFDERIRQEGSRTLHCAFALIYPTLKSQQEFIMVLIAQGEQDKTRYFLLNLLMCSLTEEIMSPFTPQIRKKQLQESLTLNSRLLDLATEQTKSLVSSLKSAKRDEVFAVFVDCPTVSPCLGYIAAVVNSILSESLLNRSEVESTHDTLVDLINIVMDASSNLIQYTQTVIEDICVSWEGAELRLGSLEGVLQGSILGLILLPIITCLSELVKQGEECEHCNIPALISMLTRCSELTKLHQTKLKDKDTPTTDEGICSGVELPAPWTTGKVVESPHPLKDSYRSKETVEMGGAKSLYLRFDPRCSTQYDYDKLTIYAGPGAGSKKVGEFGGNSLGVGARSSGGWPREPIKVEGDTVTFIFEMRSGREHTTPDTAIWGYKVTVKSGDPKEQKRFPFLVDLALSMTVLVCENLNILYKGKKIAQEELECEHLLTSKLLQKCSWEKSRKSSGVLYVEDDEIPRIKLSQDNMSRLRGLSGMRMPHMRMSVKRVIDPDALEEAVLSVVIKHLSLGEIVDNFSVHESEISLEYFTVTEIMMETYQKLYALLRKLQTIAELENHLENDLEDLKDKRLKIGETFFANYGHDESTLKDLALICFIKDVDFDEKKPLKSLEDLNKALEYEASESKPCITKPLNKTSQIVRAILLRIELLLHVSIDTTVEKTKYNTMMSRSLQSWPSGHSDSKSLKKQFSFDIEQSLDDSIIQIPKLRLRRKIRKMKQSATQTMRNDFEEDKLPQTIILDQLFEFVGSHPEKAVSPWKFLEAVGIRRERSVTRKYALIFMKQLLTSAIKSGGGTYLVNSVASLIQAGPQVSDLTCGGLVDKVREAYGDIMLLIVQHSSKFPSVCMGSIGVLCTVPYEKSEEKCLVKSGLVSLLDNLCSQTSGTKNIDQNSEINERTDPKLSDIAWAGFKVLANRCMKWQEEDVGGNAQEFRILGLAHQVSILLTNNLARATDNDKETAGNEALQEILQMLNGMSSSKMGKDILSQPSCVSKLLSLLLSPHLSPKMILTIIQLCHSALPLMSHQGFAQISLPDWMLGTGQVDVKVEDSDPVRKIVSLIFAKLADFLIPGNQVLVLCKDKKASKADDKLVPILETEPCDETNLPRDLPDMDRNLSLYIHKREDQSANEIIQQLLNVSSEMRIFRSSGNQNMEKIVSIDKELNKNHKSEVVTDDATTILRRAVKLAQQGFVVSVGPSVKLDENSDEKKNAVGQIAKDRNQHLSKFDPARPFVSSTVANSMACELIALVHSLFKSSTASVWEYAINDVIASKLSDLKNISASQDKLFNGSPNEVFEIYNKSRNILAVLSVLGGYTEFIKPGSQVKIVGENMDDSTCNVSTISDSTGQAIVDFNIPTDVTQFPRPSNSMYIPLKRLHTLQRTDPIQIFLPMVEEMIDAFQSIIVPDPTGVDPLSTALPAHGEGRSLRLATSRLIAEIRTRTLQTMSRFLEEPEFACRFLQSSCQAVDMLKYLSKDCLPSDRFSTIETNTKMLRNVYRDCIKPPAPPSRRTGTKHKIMSWDASKTYPTLKSVLFTHNMLGITYYSEPVGSQGGPRGLFVYSNQLIPPSTNHFYWEVDILSLGDSPDDSGTPVISIGLAPLAEKRDGVWSHPVGCMLFHNNGRVVHYNGSSLLQWRSLRFESHLNPGDTLGLGWEKVFEASGNIPSSGTVYFTLNGIKLDQALEEVAGNVYPVVHIQKKNTRIKANFGNTNFVYTAGQKNSETSFDHTVDENDSSDGLGNMPFHSDSDSSGASSPERNYAMGAGNRRINTYSFRTALTPKTLREYNTGSESFRTQLGNAVCSRTGNHNLSITPLDEDSDSEDEDEDDDYETEPGQREDVNSLLVKSWETKVFPIIRRRFRNEAERRDGLEQIKGALSLGMADIARQTVEFLYEENGGIPRDMHLPTIEDIKEEMSKFTIERLKKGQQVLISNLCTENAMPKFSVPLMFKTFGLPGEVLEIDVNNELVQVESYLKSEGILVRFWYPINSLEKPVDCTVKVGVTGAQVININNLHVHKELLSWEFAMTRLYCRESYVKLLKHSRNDEISGFAPVDEQSPMNAMINSNVMLLKDIDIENLQHISNHCLMTAPNGNVLEKNLAISDSTHVLSIEKGNISSLFYNNPEILKYELKDYIKQTSKKGEDYVIELTNQVCIVLQIAPEYFSTEEIPIDDLSSINSCIQLPGAAFTVASINLKKQTEDTSEVKDLTVQLQTLDGYFVKYNGQISSRDIVQYPLDTNGFKDPIYSAFTPVVMAADKVRVSHNGGEDLGVKIYLHSIPQQFPLAMSYVEEVIHASQDKDIAICITETVIYHLIETLSGFVWRYEMPQVVKERMFLTLAELIRCYKEKIKRSVYDIHLPQMQLYLQLHNELKALYEYEVSRKLHTRFSSYLQSLLELSFALTDITGLTLAPIIKKSRSPTPLSGSDKESSPTPSSLGSSFRRRLRPRRSRHNSLGSNNSDLSCYGLAPSEKFWYTKYHSLANTFRCIVDNSESYRSQAMEFIKEAFACQDKPDDYSRLLVLKGVPKHIEPENLLTIINKTLAPFGGSFKGDIFIDLPEESNSDEILHSTKRSRTTSTSQPFLPSNVGTVVLHVRFSCMVDKVKEELIKNPILSTPGEFDVADELDTNLGLNIYKVNSAFNVQNTQYNHILEKYLKQKLQTKKGELKPEVCNALEDIFLSSYLASKRFNEGGNEDESSVSLTQADILLQVEGNLVYSFFFGIKETRRALLEGIKEILEQYGVQRQPEQLEEKENVPKEGKILENQENSKAGSRTEENSIVLRVVQEFKGTGENLGLRDCLNLEPKVALEVEDTKQDKPDGELCLELDGFIRFICEYSDQDVKSVWVGLQAAGLNLELERVYPTDSLQLQNTQQDFTFDQDKALVELGNTLGRALNISPAKISPNEIYLTEAQLASQSFNRLQGLSVESLRSRYSFLVSLNNQLREVLPLVDFRAASVFSRSFGSVVSRGRLLIFYSVKDGFFRELLDFTHQRNPDQAPPEVVIDPVGEIGNKNEDVCSTVFSQALNQLSEVDSRAFNVSIAAGGDPQYPLTVRMQGDEVQGNSGSFRHFLWMIVEELHGPTLNLLVPYRGTGSYTGRYFLKPGPTNYGEEKMLQFLGQILGISMRAGIPLPLDLMPTFWMSLVNQPFSSWDLAKDFDPVTWNYLEKLQAIKQDEFSDFLSDHNEPKFAYSSLGGDYVELCPYGVSRSLNWENKEEYIEMIKNSRIKEWETRERINHIQAGLGSIVPLAYLLSTFSWSDVELKVCGVPGVDIIFLKQHTTYQVGISEGDQHVQFFWSVLESFSQEELGKFIKFACNQDRISMSGGEEGSPPPPPYPMKIAPPDKRDGDPDQQFIRVETCMFMVKLPRYSTFETMREKIIYAISCAADPLSG